MPLRLDHRSSTGEPPRRFVAALALLACLGSPLRAQVSGEPGWQVLESPRSAWSWLFPGRHRALGQDIYGNRIPVPWGHERYGTPAGVHEAMGRFEQARYVRDERGLRFSNVISRVVVPERNARGQIEVAMIDARGGNLRAGVDPRSGDVAEISPWKRHPEPLARSPTVTGAALAARRLASVVKFALVPVLITAGAGVLQEIRRSGGRPSDFDPRRALGALQPAGYWRGLAGSTAGGLAGSLLALPVHELVAATIPGGAFLKAVLTALPVIGLASAGFELGSGRALSGRSDWAELVATTIGSTVGMVIGGALPVLPGVGAVAGGMAGHALASWLYHQLRTPRGAAPRAASGQLRTGHPPPESGASPPSDRVTTRSPPTDIAADPWADLPVPSRSPTRRATQSSINQNSPDMHPGYWMR